MVEVKPALLHSLYKPWTGLQSSQAESQWERHTEQDFQYMHSDVEGS